MKARPPGLDDQDASGQRVERSVPQALEYLLDEPRRGDRVGKAMIRPLCALARGKAQNVREAEIPRDEDRVTVLSLLKHPAVRLAPEPEKTHIVGVMPSVSEVFRQRTRKSPIDENARHSGGCAHTLVSQNLGRIAQDCEHVLARDPVLLGHRLDAVASSEMTEDSVDRDPGTGDHRFPEPDVRIYADPRCDLRHGASSIGDSKANRIDASRLTTPF